MQNRLFKLGFGPLPYFRRPGVLLHISESAGDHDEESMRRLGVVVAHEPGVHGCKYGCGCDDGGRQADERCYFCKENPFYEVLFREKTVRIDPLRAIEAAVGTGSRLLLKASAMERMLPGFRIKVCVCVCVPLRSCRHFPAISLSVCVCVCAGPAPPQEASAEWGFGRRIWRRGHPEQEDGHAQDERLRVGELCSSWKQRDYDGRGR